MKTNTKIKEEIQTYEGGKASKISVLEELKRTTMSCLLWEDTFYEDGVSITERITTLVKTCIDKGYYDDVVKLLQQVKFDMKLRHCPLWIMVAIYKAGKTLSKDIITSILTRPDDMGELISLYRKDSEKAPIPNSIKKGIALALQQFDEYQLAKWNRDANYKLVDIINLCHPKVTKSIDKLVKGTLETPKTWEVLLSAAGSDVEKKKLAWEELIKTNKLPDMALLKNIRGMLNAGVSKSMIVDRISNIKNNKLLPIDFIRAAENNANLENEIEQKFLSIFEKPCLDGKTAILVDVSGSMNGTPLNYATALAMIGREMCSNIDVYSFSDHTVLVPNRRGFALRDAIDKSQTHWCTNMWASIREVEEKGYDRLIVITDEQAHDKPSRAKIKNAYIINVGTYNKGVGYYHGYKHINGFSDKVFDYICEIEK